MRILVLARLAIGCSQAEPTVQSPLPAPVVVRGAPVNAEAAPVGAGSPVLAATTTDPAEPTDAAAPSERRLLFFLNPNGRPCQLQQAILDQLGDGLGVPLEHVSVLEDANRPKLYQYGIRSLPNLILVDGAGAELHRFTPGIQAAETILAALD